MRFIRRFIGWAAQWVARSVWWPLGAKALAALAAFAALAHVGSGAAARLSGEGVAAAAPALANTVGQSSVAAAAKPSAWPSAAPSASCRCANAAPSPAFTNEGLLILNRAGTVDLQKLPRVGEKRALAIVALRDKLGRFRHVRDLLRIRGIGYRMLKQLEPLVVVDAPEPKTKKAQSKE